MRSVPITSCRGHRTQRRRSRASIACSPGGRAVAVNVDLRESEPARLTAGEFDAMVDRVEPPAARAEARGREIEGTQGYWRYGLLLMMAALVAESVVGRV